jgi:hypothetical protein
VQLSSSIKGILAEHIMNGHVPQGTHLEAAILAHMRRDLYTPDYSAYETDAESARVRHQAAARRR